MKENQRKTYKYGSVTIPTESKPITFNWSYTGQRPFKNSDDDYKVDSFLITVKYDGKQHSFDFFNSKMETEITNKESYQGWNWKDTKHHILPKMWGGYDKTKNRKEFNEKRVYYLVYGFVNCYFSDINTEIAGLKWFCDCFGYDHDSRRAESIYRQLEEEVNKAEEMGILADLKEFVEMCSMEEEGFDELIKQCLEVEE